jgi:hypothetical protein
MTYSHILIPKMHKARGGVMNSISAFTKLIFQPLTGSQETIMK